MAEPVEHRFTIWVCPECGEHITESEYDTERGRYYGHHHDPPVDWDQDEDPWFDAIPVKVVPAVVARELERERDEARGHVRHFEQGMNEWQDAWMEQRDRAERAERAADALAEGLRPFARIAERNPGIAAPEYERARDLLAEHGPLTADEEHARNAGWSDGFMDFGYPDEHGEKGSNES